MSDGKRPKSVLFVCNMNQIRSPMAEFLTRDLFGKEMFAKSAGIHSGDEDGFMQAVMAERQIDVSKHHPETLDDLEDHFFDLVVTLTNQAHEATMDFFKDEAVEIEYWETENPSIAVGRREEVLAAYRKTRKELENRIRKRFAYEI
ncbi:MAG: protein-tyrosine-phosphatase [Pseudomonadota bacterium]